MGLGWGKPREGGDTQRNQATVQAGEYWYVALIGHVVWCRTRSPLAPYEMARTIVTVFESGLIEGTSLVGIAHSASTPVLYVPADLMWHDVVFTEHDALQDTLYSRVRGQQTAVLAHDSRRAAHAHPRAFSEGRKEGQSVGDHD